MTNEETQRAMEFIIEHQAQFAASMQRLEEERRRDAPRLAQLEESFKTLVQLAENTDSRIDTVESNSKTLEEERRRDTLRLVQLEESFQLLVRLAENIDVRIDTLESNSNSHERSMSTLQAHMTALAEAQAHADKRLSALIDIVRQDRNGKSQDP